ncbi:MAG: AMIN domain-containing protein, partial [Gammaproteobacteria bacterium]|nr:AMIN domain-containing protein [Gammaproteobacteria bacterium]
MLLVFSGAPAALAADAPAGNQLTDIQVQPLAGDSLELRLVTSGNAPAPLAFTIDNPARISLDLQGTTLALPARRKDVKIGVLDTILA